MAGDIGTGIGTDTDTVRRYVEAVRDRPRQPLDPERFTIDWSDRPSPHTRYPGAPRIALPPARAESVAGGLGHLLTDSHSPCGQGGLSADLFAGMLHLAAGPLSRRWQIDWNLDASRRARLQYAAWGRGTPSGGSNYPWELYWVAPPAAAVAPGLLHYASGQHVLERLVTGDLTKAVRTALPQGPSDDASGGYLVCTMRPWKTAFKYSAFSYQVATHDIGAFLGSWSALSRAVSVPYRAHLWFDEPALNAVLGLDPAEESVHAVLPLAWRSGQGAGAAAGAGPRAAPAARYGAGAPPRPSASQASSRTRGFPVADAVRRATVRMLPDRSRSDLLLPVAAPADCPPVAARSPAGELPTGAVVLPEPELPGTGLGELLSTRRSANGRFDPGRPLTAGELAAVLACGAAAPGHRLTRILVGVHRVEGVAPGSYQYDRDRHALIPSGPVHGAGPNLTEHHYSLQNYSVAQAAAVVALAWRTLTSLKELGPRAYRAAHADAGAGAQYLHLAAQAVGVGCGLVLGMDPRAVDEALAGDDPELRTTLYLFLGHRLPGAATVDDRLA